MSFVPTDVRFPAKLRTDVRGIRHELESLVLEHAIESASWLLMLRDEQFEPIVCGIEGASWEALCDIACRLRDSRKALVQAQTRTPVGATS
jgi:hypothetical protein